MRVKRKRGEEKEEEEEEKEEKEEIGTVDNDAICYFVLAKNH